MTRNVSSAFLSYATLTLDILYFRALFWHDYTTDTRRAFRTEITAFERRESVLSTSKTFAESLRRFKVSNFLFLFVFRFTLVVVMGECKLELAKTTLSQNFRLNSNWFGNNFGLCKENFANFKDKQQEN